MSGDADTFPDARGANAKTRMKNAPAKKPAAKKPAAKKPAATKPIVTKPTEPAAPEVLVSDFSVATPPDFDIPAMIAPQEKNYLYWLASTYATGAGAVVEFGVWLGASTACLAAGLGGRPLHCYDHFVWGRHYNAKSHVQLEHGADFSHLFAGNMERAGANVILHKTTIKEARWAGGPIELLIVDAPTSADSLVQALKAFAPSLIPDASHVAIQNYQYFPSYQLAVVLDAVRDSIALEHVVIDPRGKSSPNTVCFRVLAPVDLAAATEAAKTFKTWPVERIHETWARIMAQLPDQTRARLAPGLALFLHDAGHGEAAVEALASTPMDAIMVKRWQRLASNLRSRYPLLYAPMEETHAAPASA
jgi:hypothetical protein